MKIASSCKDFADFRNRYPQVRMVAQTMGWIDDIKAILPHKTYWNREMCEREIKEKGYKTKDEFRKGNAGAHGWAYKHGILDELFAGKEAPGNYNRKKIYVYEFGDGYAYVGLTDDLDRREYQHKNEKSPVKDHIKETGLQPERKILSDWLTKDEAQVYEDEMINSYAAAGWKMLNKKKGGALGRKRDLIYTLDELNTAAHTCKRRKEFKDKYSAMYEFLLRHDLLEEVLGWMPKFYMPPICWTDERLQEVFKECNCSYKELRKKYPGAVGAIEKRELQNKIFGRPKKIFIRRTIEEAIAESKNYKSVAELRETDNRLYCFITRHNLQDVCFEGMKYNNMHANYTWDEIEKVINSCKNLTQMRNEHSSEYRAALRNEEWRRELFKRLPSRKHKSNL